MSSTRFERLERLAAEIKGLVSAALEADESPSDAAVAAATFRLERDVADVRRALTGARS
jgi:hypothetical protein